MRLLFKGKLLLARRALRGSILIEDGKIVKMVGHECQKSPLGLGD